MRNGRRQKTLNNSQRLLFDGLDRPTCLDLFCGAGGATGPAAAAAPPSPTCLDLFCGAGGLSLGLQQAGFNVIFAADRWRAAIETYRENLGAHVVAAEIDERTELPAADVLVGGPPCQGFSSAGLRKAGDDRNTLVS